jgi:hypothetical protein
MGIFSVVAGNCLPATGNFFAAMSNFFAATGIFFIVTDDFFRVTDSFLHVSCHCVGVSGSLCGCRDGFLIADSRFWSTFQSVAKQEDTKSLAGTCWLRQFEIHPICCGKYMKNGNHPAVGQISRI